MKMSRQIAIQIKQADKIKKSWFFKDIGNVPRPYSYVNMYTDHCGDTQQCDGLILTKASVYRDMNGKDEISVSDLNSDVLPAIELFNMRFFSLTQNHSPDCKLCEKVLSLEKPKTINAFDFMMKSSAMNDESNMPKKTENPSSGIDRIKNEFLTYLQDNKCKFPKGTSSWAQTFVNQSIELLFYVDNHYVKMAEHVPGVGVPSIADRFCGFNMPEKHKHKKRMLSNLSKTKLQTLSTNLKLSIQSKTFLNFFPWA